MCRCPCRLPRLLLVRPSLPCLCFQKKAFKLDVLTSLYNIKAADKT